MLYNVSFLDTTNIEDDDPEPIQKVYEKDTIIPCVDNPEVLNYHGISSITIVVDDEHWHIWKVSGYTGRSGPFTYQFDFGV